MKKKKSIVKDEYYVPLCDSCDDPGTKCTFPGCRATLCVTHSHAHQVVDAGIKSYLPEKQQLSLIQAKIPVDVGIQVRVLIRKHKLSWNSVVTACLKKFVDEMGDT